MFQDYFLKEFLCFLRNNSKVLEQSFVEKSQSFFEKYIQNLFVKRLRSIFQND